LWGEVIMITKKMLINDIINMDDRMIQVLLGYGLNCHGCPGAESETLEEAAKGHDVDFNKLLKDLNALITEKVKNEL
jgi:hybrid cluster-associated redox disulfide protein